MTMLGRIIEVRDPCDNTVWSIVSGPIASGALKDLTDKS